MKLKNKVIESLANSKLSIHNRMFLLTSAIAIIFWFVASVATIFVAGMKLGLPMLAGSLLILGLVYCGYYYKRMDHVALIISAFISVVCLPVAYFMAEIYGMIPVMLGYVVISLYITVVLPRGRRRAMLSILALSLAGCMIYDYNNTRILDPGPSPAAYIYTFITTSFICALVSMIVGLQIRLFLEEAANSDRQREEIERLNQSQNNFFSSMSHEIRTPINTIIGLNEMILREDVSDEVAEDAANIQSASKLLLNLINDILDMSKFESGQMTLNEDNYHPGDMLSEIVGMLWLRAKEKGLEFHVRVAPDVPAELFGDEVRIKQVLINVINNAIKYTKEGSVTLTIECGERNGNMLHVVYSVADTGMGIKKEDIPYLFTAFKRVDENSNKHIEGTGLGLAIVKQFVELMEGTVTVNSVYTKGSTFIIDIPQRVVNEDKIGDIDVEARHRITNRLQYHQKFEAPEARVLVVDDNASNILVVNKLLRDTKVKIDTASSGAEALAKTVNREYHVILMDHLMPEMDGIECHRQILTQPGGRCRESKIVALTANAGADMQALYAKEGFDGYLVKPVSGEMLERELLRLLPRDLVITTGDEEEIVEETMQWMHTAQRKRNVLITTESVADLPKEICDKYGIVVVPHMVRTEEGIFRDGQEIETKGLLSYMEDPDKKVQTVPPNVTEMEAFFADALTKANNVIHISISSKATGSGCPIAIEAANSFDNVTVIDSGHLSSGQGIMAIEAAKMAEQGKNPKEIVKYVKSIKNDIHTSFIVDNLDFMARAEQISKKVAKTTRAFTVHPMVILRGGDMGVGNLFFGARKKAWQRYIAYALKHDDRIVHDILFVTYVGLTKRDTDYIREEIEKRAKFEKIYFQKASPAIAVNCGAGTFGLLYKTEG